MSTSFLRLTRVDRSQSQILREFLTLPQKCRDSSQNLYIKSLRGGVECSTDSSSVSPVPLHTGGVSWDAKPTEQEYIHVFLVEFGSVEEREYYKAVDPVHADFAARIIPMLDYISRCQSFRNPTSSDAVYRTRHQRSSRWRRYRGQVRWEHFYSPEGNLREDIGHED